MTDEKILNQFVDATVNMDIEAAKKACKDAMDQDIDAFKIIQDGILNAVTIIGDKSQCNFLFTIPS